MRMAGIGNSKKRAKQAAAEKMWVAQKAELFSHEFIRRKQQQQRDADNI